MVITYHGGGCLRFQSGDTSLLVNPEGGRLKADVTLRTEQNTESISAEAVSFSDVSLPGEYELRGIAVWGHQVPGEKKDVLYTVYEVVWENICIVIIGQGTDVPGPEIWDRIGSVDVLAFPVGKEKGCFSVAEATKLVRNVEPSVVVPYPPVGAVSLAKEIGRETKPEDRFTFKKKDLEEGACQVVVFKGK